MEMKNCDCDCSYYDRTERKRDSDRVFKHFSYFKESRRRSTDTDPNVIRGLTSPLHQLNFLLLILFFLFTLGSGSEPPTIFPSERTTIPKLTGESLTIRCEGDEPLSWYHENVNLITDKRVTITESPESNSSRNYSSSLHINGLSLTDGGNIVCYYNGSSHSDHERADLKQILVRDEKDHLLKDAYIIGTIYGVQGGNAVIPCIRLWDEVKLTLLHTETDILVNNEYYSPGLGYTIHNLTQEHLGTYHCIGQFEDEKEETIFNVRFPPPQTSVPPSIKTANGINSFYVGEEFEVVCDTVQKSGIHYNLEIIHPSGEECEILHENNSRITCSKDRPTSDTNSWYKKMTVRDAEKEDAGVYQCLLRVFGFGKQTHTYRNITIGIYEKGEEFINVSTEKQSIEVAKGKQAKWIINVSSFPPTFNTTLLHPKGRVVKLKRDPRFNFSKTQMNDRYKLEIYDVDFADNGSYPLTISLPQHNVNPEILRLNLKVTAPPEVNISSRNEVEKNCMFNQICEIKCNASGGPAPAITWAFQECDADLKCKEPIKFVDAEDKKDGFITRSTIRFKAMMHRNYTCTGVNSIDRTEATQFVRVVDYPGRGPISIISPEEIVSGDDVEITCAVTKLRQNGNVSWVKYENGKDMDLPLGFRVIEADTPWSFRRKLIINNIRSSAAGIFHCKTNSVRDSIKLKIIEAYAPKFVEENLNNSKVSLRLGESMNLTCIADGKPNPVITWFWNGHPHSEKSVWPSDMKYALISNGSILHLKFVPVDAQGTFKCEAKNRNGTVERFIDLTVTGSRVFSNLAVIIILVLFIAVIIFGAVLARYKYKQGELNRFLKEIKQKDFYNGAIENINPDLSVTDQAYLLPFDSRWEFPKERLRLGIQLGSGAFGRVVKADATGILDSEPRTTVAVKMVKPNADESHFKALMSELKIMVHLGKHINVVNLLGACTKNLAKKKELFVIVEYCKYGSLLSYMHRHKRTFINQLDPAKGTIDPNIDWQTSRNSAQSQARTLHYAQLTFTDTGNSRKHASNGYKTLDEFKENDGPPTTPTLRPIDPGNMNGSIGYFQCSDMSTPNCRRSTDHYVPESQVESACTGISYLSNGPSVLTTDGTTKRTSSWDHYRGDYQVRDVTPIKTTDLLCWAFQIARGMDYLASRKVLHGDLAARNVLLAENNVVKICDFGLAKEMYKDYKYKKKSEGVLLPVKWMAIESIYYGLFSSQSDCWSFGVVLWELFTLGKTPYPGMDADERFYRRILEGYRMEKPTLAPSCVYDIMLECWSQEPTERPTFSALVDRIGDMMEEGLRNHYVDLNSPYVKINQTYMAGRPDYLLQMGRSDFASVSARPTPERQYENLPEDLDNSGYLKPIPPPLSPGGGSMPSSPSSTYQNVPSQDDEPACVLLANNSGYNSCAFVKLPEEKHGDHSNEILSSFQDDKDTKPTCTLQIRYSPDIKDMYGLREDSTSPDRNSLSDNAFEETQAESTTTNDVPNGIDNINYVPFSFQLLPKNESKSPRNSSSNENSYEESSSCKSTTKPKRQKNDSGLGSIDSTQLDSQRCNSAESHNNDLGMLQQPNGYISHKYITT